MIGSAKFQKGDCVLYGARAVCRVSDIGPLSFGDKSRLYYTLRPVFENHGETIYAPLESRISIRPVISKNEAESCISSAARVEGKMAAMPDEQQSALQSQDCMVLLAHVKALKCREATLTANKRHLRESDRRFLEQAEKLLYGELAAVLETSLDDVKQRTEAGFGI